MEVVRSALGHDLDGAAVGAAGVGAEALGLEVELADGVEGEVLHQPPDGVVVVVAAVDQVVDVASAAAVDLGGELGGLGGVGVEAEAHPGNERGQVAELPAVQGQVLDLGPRDDLSDARLRGVDERNLGGDGELLGLTRHLELHLGSRGGAHVDDDAPGARREPGQVVFHLVRADRQPGQPVDPDGVRDRRPGEAGRNILGGHVGPGQGSTLIVEDLALDRARRALGECRAGRPKEQEHERPQMAQSSHPISSLIEMENTAGVMTAHVARAAPELLGAR